jgi:hypothetical protein
VTDGLNVVDTIAQVKTGHKPPHADVPLEDIVLISGLLGRPVIDFKED